jgi:hypothetical protein
MAKMQTNPARLSRFRRLTYFDGNGQNARLAGALVQRCFSQKMGPGHLGESVKGEFGCYRRPC